MPLLPMPNLKLNIIISQKGESTNNLQPISKNEFNYLIKNKILQVNKLGNFKESTGDKKMVVTGVNKNNRDGTSSRKNSKQKQKYIIDSIYKKLMESKEKDKQEFDISKVKENQRYLFSSSVS